MSATATGLRQGAAVDTHAPDPELTVSPSAIHPIPPAEFVRTHFAFVWRTLRRFGVPESDAQDAAQRVFVIATERLDRIQQKKERAFLFGTAVRVADKVRRSHARKPTVSDSDPDGEPSPWPSADELLDQRRARAVLDSILDEMTDDLRAVFVLYEIEQMTVNDISNVLEIPLGTAASRLRRAREVFRERARAHLGGKP
jgi:RNA polymerase sigma-70 factor (ECF subfamily)